MIFSLFTLKAYYFFDPDFGWRVQTGRFILTHGIPKEDVFTYTMPSYPWVDHAWGQDVLIALLFDSLAGKVGLALFYSLFSVFALFYSLQRAEKYVSLISEKYIKSKFISKKLRKSVYLDFIFLALPLLLSVSIFFMFTGVRVQTLTWFLFSLFLYFLLDKKRWGKYRKFSPLFFLVWANLHGGFASGIVAWILVIVTDLYVKKTISTSEIIFFIVSFLITLINPYGVDLWREVLSSVSDKNLIWSITEWSPSIFIFDWSLIILVVVSLLSVFRYRQKMNPVEIVLFFFFFVQSVVSRRHLPLWVITAVPIVLEGIYYLSEDTQKIKYALERLLISYSTFFLIITFLTGFSIFVNFKSSLDLSENGFFYPSGAVNYINTNKLEGNVFTTYDWAGYLIYKSPQNKVFVDGRMPSWNWKAPRGELDSAFNSYKEIVTGRSSFSSFSDEFDVKIVLWSKAYEDEARRDAKIEGLLRSVGIKDFINISFEKELINKDWEKVYEDGTAVLFRRM